MSKEREVLKLARDVLLPYKSTGLRWYTDVDEALDAIEEVLAQPEEQRSCDRRTWVGLTDEDIKAVNAQVSQIPPIDYTTTTYARAIETKLKEKNT